MSERQEVLMVGVLLRVRKPVTVDERFKSIFHGKTKIPVGSYVYWYPIKNLTYSRKVNELSRRYKIKVEYGIAGSAEI